MRFSLRNSQVEISFLCLRSLLMLLLRLSNTPDGHSFHPTSRQPLKKSSGEWNIFYPSTHSLYMRRRVPASPSSISFYRVKKSIASPLLSPERLAKFSFFDFTLSYRLDLRGMTFLSARTRYKRVLQPRHRNVTSSY